MRVPSDLPSCPKGFWYTAVQSSMSFIFDKLDCRELGPVWQLWNLWWWFKSASFHTYFTSMALGLTLEEAVLPLSLSLTCCTAALKTAIALYCNSKLWHYQSSNVCWTLSWASSIHFLFPHLIFLILIVMLLSSCLPTGYFLRDYPTKNSRFLPFLHPLNLSVTLVFHCPNNTGDRCRSYSFLSCNIRPSYIPSPS